MMNYRAAVLLLAGRSYIDLYRATIGMRVEL
jgi:hypothetical protein